MPYCPKCGKEVSDDAKYCPYCREPLKSSNIFYRRAESRDEKNEKDERDEKSEKDEKHEDNVSSSIMGGLVLLWLGISFLLREYGYIRDASWWSYFLLGLGVILFLRGILSYSKTSSWRSAQGYLIGGIIVSLIGVSDIINLRNWWGLILIIFALYIILTGLGLRDKNPKP
jgi:hypothetical protein